MYWNEIRPPHVDSSIRDPPSGVSNGTTKSWMHMPTAWPPAAGCESSMWKVLTAYEPAKASDKPAGGTLVVKYIRMPAVFARFALFYPFWVTM